MEGGNEAFSATFALTNAGEQALTTNTAAAAKKRGKMSLFRVAMYMLRKSSDNHHKSKPAFSWKKIFASMRLLHLHDTPHQSPGHVNDGVVVEKLEDDYVMESPDKSPSSSSSCSSYEGESRFASAMDLQALDKIGETDNDEDEDDEGDEKFDDSRGDAMIDEKAELFIAKFYEQMRIQHEEIVNRQHKRKMSRG